jgi:high-affinity iron transporter
MRKMTLGLIAALLLCSTAWAGDAAKGKEVYDSRCSFCHGSNGKGDGPAGAALQPRPTNFTDPTFWKTASPEMVKMIVANGKAGTAMVPFGQTLKAGEIDDVVAYLQTLK